MLDRPIAQQEDGVSLEQSLQLDRHIHILYRHVVVYQSLCQVEFLWVLGIWQGHGRAIIALARPIQLLLLKQDFITRILDCFFFEELKDLVLGVSEQPPGELLRLGPLQGALSVGHIEHRVVEILEIFALPDLCSVDIGLG